MTNADYIKTLHPGIRDKVQQGVDACNKRLTGRAQFEITFGMRTIDQQNDIYAQGRTKPGPIVTNAMGGQSYHNYGLAFDGALLIDGKRLSWDIAADWDGDKEADFMECVDVFKSLGFEWGGDWVKEHMSKSNDFPHFEMRFGHTWHDLLASVHAGHIYENGYVKL